MSGILIYNVTILTMNSSFEVVENGSLLIKENIIEGIYKEKPTAENCPTLPTIGDLEEIDGQGGILIPGFVNCHCHGSMVFYRSLGDDVKDRLKKFIFPLEKKLTTPNLVYVGSKYAIAEMLLGGVTTFCDMYYFEEDVARACEEMGMRGVLGETVVDFPAPDCPEPYGGIDYAREFIKKWKGHKLITPAIAPHAPYTNDAEHLQLCHEVSVAFDVPLLIHLAEMDFEVEQLRAEHGLSPVAYLKSLGILDKNFIGAHCVLMNQEDIEILKECNASVAHCIGANSKGAKGVAPVLSLLEAGVKVGLGTDGAMSGNTLDILTQMPLVGKIHKLHAGDRTVLPAKDIVRLATIGGAEALGMDKCIGSIEVGKLADVVLVETKSVNMQPIFDYYSVLVYSANPSNVDTTIVNGQILVRNKQLQIESLSTLQGELQKQIDTFKSCLIE